MDVLCAQVWRQACKKLGIEGVSLYAGTRHTTVTALQQHTGPDIIKKFTQHETNQAFDRYLYPDRSMHLSMRKLAETAFEKNSKSTVLEFENRKEKNGP